MYWKILKSKPTLFLICGLPCSGKTTLAKKLELEKRALRFTPDEWMSRLADSGFDEEKRFIVETIQIEIAMKCLTLGINVILDFGFWSRAERDQLKKQAQDLGAMVKIHFCNIPIDELINRLRTRNVNLPNDTFHITEEQLREYQSLFQAPTYEELK